MRRIAAALLVLGTLSQGASAQDRLPPIPTDQLTPEQRRAVTEFREARKADPTGPFVPLLRSPEAMSRVRAMGDYLRFRNALPSALNEFLILVTARQMDNQYEWDVHYPLAIAAGVDPQTLAALAAGGVPPAMTTDERLLFNMVDEQTRTHRVSNETYTSVVTRFGEKGLIDALATNGYYTLLGVVLNASQTPGTGGAPTLRPRAARP